MTPFIHLYADRACVCDGKDMKIVPLTNEQIIRLAAESTKLASSILEAWHVRATSPGDVAVRPHTHAGGPR